MQWLASYIAIHLEKKKDLHQNSPLPKKELISVVWLSAKKGLSEYLKKHPASTALPSPLGTQTCILLDATFKQFWQPLSVAVSTHCATAYTVALPLLSTTSLLLAAKKPLILGVATWRSFNNPSAAVLKARRCDAVRFPQDPWLPGRVVWSKKLLLSYLKTQKAN